jgi:curved DNA-binding protein
MDPYKTLGVKKDASEEEIKKVYRKLAKECHPDTNPGDKDREKRFKEISEAYAILSDKEKRNEYDKSQNMNTFTFSDMNFSSYEDIFNSYGNVFYGGKYNDIMKNLFKEYAESKTKGQDVEISLEIDFLESVNGCERIVEVKRDANIKNIQVTIPKDVKDGQKIKIKGMGKESPNGGEKGNLIIHIKIKKDPYFKRDGNDIFVTEYIPFSTAVLGGTSRVRTISGKVVLNILKGTKAGTKIKLEGKGINGGNQYIEIQIDVPANINYEQKKIIEELQKSGL